MLENRVDASDRREAQQTDKRRGIVFGAAVGGCPWRALRVSEEGHLRVHGNVRGRGSRKACGDVLG